MRPPEPGDPAAPSGASAGDSPADALTREGAGDRAIRGGVLRVGGFVAGLLLTAVGSIVLLRYLGRDDFGRFTVVVSITAVITALSDAGLTVVGQRGYVLREDESSRKTFLGDLLGIRLLLTPFAVIVAALLALLLYPADQVWGVVITGVGLLFANAALTLTVPLTAHLRLGTATVIELIRQATLVGGLVALALVSASFVSVFWAYAVSGVAMLAAAAALVDRRMLSWPRFDATRWRAIVGEAGPVALSLVVNVIYLKLLIILTSQLTSDGETGLFGTSSRILDIFIGIPQLMAGAALPILAHAAAHNEVRLAYVLQRLADASLLVAGAIVLGTSIGAPTLIAILGGAEYRGAAPVLAIQVFALLGAFLTQVWILGLVVIERRAALAFVSAVGLVVVLVAGAVLIPLFDAKGAALAAILGEAALAGSALFCLVRARPALRPSLGRAARIVAAGALGALCALLPIPDLPRAVLAVLVYAGAALALRAVPLELLRALRSPTT